MHFEVVHRSAGVALGCPTFLAANRHGISTFGQMANYLPASDSAAWHEAISGLRR